ncbi:IS110 family transposase [Puniceibacterium confluentis]|uniref:IS110 family transposase n=1 Tax=Puniceibacterium confluentis TaxID=1958944 RepID=UPI0011B3A3D2|nr:IS110 family transposase [Puniceibacterium confluentis]
MEEVTVIGIDLAKSVFQLPGATVTGAPMFRKKLSRAQVLKFLGEQPPCLVAMEACASSHYWGREIMKLGHEVRLIPPIYVKPFVKRQKNDANDAEAIAEAVVRPTMRFVPVKSAEQQARSMVFKTRDLFVRQRNAIINALRGHLMEYGIIAPPGRTFVKRLAKQIDAPNSDLPPVVIELCRLHLDQLDAVTEKIKRIEKRLKEAAGSDPETIRLQTAPGVGPVSAMAIQAFAPPLEGFRRGRDFAAWLGLVPVQKSTGGKQVLGRTSKMGQRDIRRLLIIGAMTRVRWAVRNGAPKGSWLEQMLARKPRMLVAIALANKTARAIWAMMTKKEDFKDPVAVA